MTEDEKRALEAAGDSLVETIREHLDRCFAEMEKGLDDEPEDWPEGKL